MLRTLVTRTIIASPTLPVYIRRTMTEVINVEVVSDNVCPWCYVGKKNLEKAIDAAGDNYKINVTWKPYQLRPDTPKEGTPFSDLKKRYPNFEQMQIHLNNMGKDAGINFIERTIIPNTLDSHRLVNYAKKHGDENLMITKLFSSYFEEGKNIGDQQVLAEIAQSAGLDPVAVKKYLASNEDVEAVKHEVQEAQVRDIHGVPHFTISKEGTTKKFSVSGGQPPQTFLSFFNKL